MILSEGWADNFADPIVKKNGGLASVHKEAVNSTGSVDAWIRQGSANDAAPVKAGYTFGGA